MVVMVVLRSLGISPLVIVGSVKMPAIKDINIIEEKIYIDMQIRMLYMGILDNI